MIDLDARHKEPAEPEEPLVENGAANSANSDSHGSEGKFRFKFGIFFGQKWWFFFFLWFQCKFQFCK